MLFDFSAQDIRNGRLPANAPDWLAAGSDGLTVAGDRVSYRESFAWTSDDRVLIATQLEELLPKLDDEAIGPEVSPFGISQTLNYGIVPLPSTVYRSVQRLGPGDTLTLTCDAGQVDTSLAYTYPWLFPLSREDQVPSTTKLRELIATSLDKQLDAAGGTGMLMLSSGKDSVALALALADGGHTSIPCVTFQSGPDDDEHVYAAELCERLGLEHHTVQMPDDGRTTEAALLHFFEHSPLPSVDQATIPYAIATHTSGLQRGGIIDGCGNDGYMGFLPLSRTRTKYALRVRNRHLATTIRGLIPHDSPMNYFTRSRVATFLQGRMFRHKETRRFYGDAIDTEDHWYQMSSDLADLELLDFIGASEVRLTDTAVSNAKVYLAAHARGLVPVLPFCDEAIADYYFNLPAAHRLDESSRTNKILLRQLLSEAIDYDPAEVGSNHFQFDGTSFIQENERFVRDEILSCDLWLPQVEGELNTWLDQLPSRPFLFHSLLTLFMISGWHNHYPSIDRKPG